MTRAATRYLLDTSVLSELLCPRPAPAVVQRLQGLLARQLFASAMSRFELRYGARLHPDGDRLWQRIEGELLPLVQWLPIDAAVALQAADQAARDRRAGRPTHRGDGPGAWLRDGDAQPAALRGGGGVGGGELVRRPLVRYPIRWPCAPARAGDRRGKARLNGSSPPVPSPKNRTMFAWRLPGETESGSGTLVGAWALHVDGGDSVIYPDKIIKSG